MTVIYQGQLQVHKFNIIQLKRGRHIYRINMSRKYLNKKNNGRFIKESKTKIRNNPTPRLHGDLSHLNIKELKTTGKRSQHHQVC